MSSANILMANKHIRPKKTYIQRDLPGHKRSFSDTIHTYIDVYKPVLKIIDSFAFQRLRNIKQLGFSYLVYPSADHSRFTHSLGVYNLARKYVKSLAKKYNFEKKQHETPITECDQLCVCIAALCHDLGHGPFSHLYEYFLKRVDPDFNYKHETFSVKVFEHMLDHDPEVKRSLYDYLDDQDITFIKELIDPPENFFDDNNCWALRGRDESKSALYGIVKNVHDSIDVCKFDYLLRDAKLTNLNIPFGEQNLKRILRDSKILDNQITFVKECKRIAYVDKIKCDIKAIMDSRKLLHEEVYQQKTVIGIEQMMLEAFVKAADDIKRRGKNGELVDFARAHLDLEAFLEFDDYIFGEILRSYSILLEEPRKILKQVERRKIVRFVGSICLTDMEYVLQPIEDLEAMLKKRMLEYDEKLKTIQLYIAARKIHRGMEELTDPLTKALFFNEKDPLDTEPYTVETNVQPCIAKMFVYVPLGTSDVRFDKVHSAMKKCATKFYKTEPPLKDGTFPTASYENCLCLNDLITRAW